MKLKNILPVLALLFFSGLLHAQIFMAKTCEVSFYSDAVVEDIAAVNKSSKPILIASKNEIGVKVTIKGFDFEKELMEEHFNEKYLESDKYPYAEFKGKINETIDYTKEGTHKVTVTGKLTMHGVEKERTIDGTLTIKGGDIGIESKFKVALKDHKIEIPTLVTQNISEIVEVTITATLSEYKK